MSIPTTNEFLNLMEPEEQKYYKFGKIDPAYTSGRPKIVFDLESVPSIKQYPYLASYAPVANDRVIMLKVAGSYVILGKII